MASCDTASTLAAAGLGEGMVGRWRSERDVIQGRLLS